MWSPVYQKKETEKVIQDPREVPKISFGKTYRFWSLIGHKLYIILLHKLYTIRIQITFYYFRILWYVVPQFQRTILWVLQLVDGQQTHVILKIFTWHCHHYDICKRLEHTLSFENCTILLEVGRKWDTWPPLARGLLLWLLFNLSNSAVWDDSEHTLSASTSLLQERILPAYRRMSS